MPPWHPVPNLNSSASNSLSSAVYSGDRLSGASSGGSGGGGGRADKENKAAVRKNPVSHWRVSKRAVVGEFHQIFLIYDRRVPISPTHFRICLS